LETPRHGRGDVVGVREAAAIAGVSVSTLRRWADEDRVASFRTTGGHRRFRVDELQRALSEMAPIGQSTGVAHLGEIAANEIRQHLSTPRPAPDWLDRIDGPARERLGLLGRQLIQVVEEYVGGERSRAAVLCEAQALGLLYGRELVAARLTLRQGLEAFTFFRRGLEDAGRRFAAAADATVTADDLRDQLDVLNDRLLLGIAEAYDGSPTRQPGALPKRSE
jgi:excisionase family DNA binding protein